MRARCDGHRGRVIVCAIGLCFVTSGCASGMGDKVVGQPCTRSDQCAATLVCSGGACVAVGGDAGNPDAAMDDDAGVRPVIRK